MNQILELIIKLVFFLAVIVLIFYPAGAFLVEKIDKKLHANEKIILAFLSSISLFVILTLILGYLKLRFLMLPMVVCLNLYAILTLKSKLLSLWKEAFKDKKLLLLILLAIIIQGVINFPSGYLFKEGLMFWSSQGNDGLWHVALMEEAKKSMPLLNPIYSGEKLYNYHYLSDILMGEFGRLIPYFGSLDLYFRFFPIIFSFFMSLSVFSFVTRWRNSKAAGYWAIFFTSLCGNFGYVVTFIKNQQLFGGETVFWAAQGNTIIGNPPHAIAYALLTTCFLAITLYLRERNKKYLALAFIVGMMVAGYKVSGGFVLVMGLIVAAIVDLLLNKRKEMFLLAFGLGLSNLIALKLMSKGAGSFLVWEPWWFVRTTITAPGRVEWMDLEFRRQHYVSKHTFKATLRVIQVELEAFLIFVVGNLGMRIIGLLTIFEKGKKGIGLFFKDTLNVLLISSMLSGLLIVLLFVQKGIAYNLIQFFQYSILIFGFFAAAATSALLTKIKKTLVKWVVALIIIIFSLPTVIGNLVEFYGPERTPLAKISNNEIKALNYLKQNSSKEALILTIPFDKDARWGFESQPQPWPISVWYSTAYISSISSRRTFLTNEGQADILGIPIQDRREQVDKFFLAKDDNYQIQFLKSNNIDYLYLIKREIPDNFKTEDINISKYYENDEVIIYTNL